MITMSGTGWESGVAVRSCISHKLDSVLGGLCRYVHPSGQSFGVCSISSFPCFFLFLRTTQIFLFFFIINLCSLRSSYLILRRDVKRELVFIKTTCGMGWITKNTSHASYIIYCSKSKKHLLEGVMMYVANYRTIVHPS